MKPYPSYSFNKNHVHFVAINTEGEYGPSSSQYKFIDQDLNAASTNADIDWIVVFLHEPMYTSPSHHDPLASLRDAYHPLFTQVHTVRDTYSCLKQKPIASRSVDGTLEWVV